MTNVCIECAKWRDAQKKILMECDSIFDAIDDIKAFEDECVNTCPLKNSDKNS